MPRNVDLKIEKALRFIEELSWLLKSYDGVDLKFLESVVKRRSENRFLGGSSIDNLSDYMDPNLRVDSLVGILPKIFMNPRWFASNSDIAEFATSALGMKIPRWEKISKFEMIGHIVCNLALKDQKIHRNLVRILSDILADKSKERFVTDMRKEQVSWNEIIRRFG
jgi:hypothetical protein